MDSLSPKPSKLEAYLFPLDITMRKLDRIVRLCRDLSDVMIIDIAMDAQAFGFVDEQHDRVSILAFLKKSLQIVLTISYYPLLLNGLFLLQKYRLYDSHLSEGYHKSLFSKKLK